MHKQGASVIQQTMIKVYITIQCQQIKYDQRKILGSFNVIIKQCPQIFKNIYQGWLMLLYNMIYFLEPTSKVEIK